MKKLSFILSFILLISCSKDFLETENTNAPDLETVLADPGDWEAVIARQFNVIWHATQEADASIVIAGMADVITSSWGNLWMQYQTSEPRVSILNTIDNRLVEWSYYENFKVIGSVNDILRLMNERPDAEVLDDQGTDIRQKLKAAALFLRGMAYGNIALKYDQAQYVDETVNVIEAPQLPFEPYTDLLEKALGDLEMAISVAASIPDFTLNYYNGVILTNDQYSKLIRTLQAKYSLHISRDAVENEANDWRRILAYAQQGLDFDFVVMGDGIDWHDPSKWLISNTPFPFARVDYRLIAAMAEDTPTRFPEDGSHPLPEPIAIDQRLITDMQYEERINYRPDRGLYHFSHYIYIRYLHHGFSGTGEMPWILKAENDLMIAEALIRTAGDRQEAARLINLTRVGRGQLAAFTGDESDQELLDAIMHERFVELLATNGGQAYFDRRRLPDDDGSLLPYSGLQPGTPEQFPVPAKELNILGMELYTF